jgi:hypothetical protein
MGIGQISASDAEQLPNKTAEIGTERGQYVVGIDVFHQLHCLNRLRKLLRPERYHLWDNATETDKAEWAIHDGMWHSWRLCPVLYLTSDCVDHCIDSIRQSLMCSSDISTIYWQWSAEKHQVLPRAGTTHTCRNFEKIKAWAVEHKLKHSLNNLIRE